MNSEIPILGHGKKFLRSELIGTREAVTLLIPLMRKMNVIVFQMSGLNCDSSYFSKKYEYYE